MFLIIFRDSVNISLTTFIWVTLYSYSSPKHSRRYLASALERTNDSNCFAAVKYFNCPLLPRQMKAQFLCGMYYSVRGPLMLPYRKPFHRTSCHKLSRCSEKSKTENLQILPWIEILSFNGHTVRGRGTPINCEFSCKGVSSPPPPSIYPPFLNLECIIRGLDNCWHVTLQNFLDSFLEGEADEAWGFDRDSDPAVVTNVRENRTSTFLLISDAERKAVGAGMAFIEIAAFVMINTREGEERLNVLFWDWFEMEWYLNATLVTKRSFRVEWFSVHPCETGAGFDVNIYLFKQFSFKSW